ncbi:hypothetical protein BFP72_03165 [Reichenbachiella sp. 5M10]|uniref:TlpA family protein disulfide reductase n=1 Tax=Reichenbachiella sp. 5M10 TaxID=1889772 RepID=UPI000C439284|nr:TlpA disulfide reductase family protein [Reichenbachiella sp. 5M10]PIB34481.1 hypothetical protein BFP72_03165 [Reichenbachiella sp. 5M10]
MKITASFLHLSLAALLFFSACSTPEPHHSQGFTLEVKGLDPSTSPKEILLYQITDPAQNSYSIVDTIAYTTGTSIKKSIDLPPNYYVLHIDETQVPLLANKGQHILINLSTDGSYEVSGSEDTELFQAYESFRHSILEKTVYPVRKELYQLRDINNPKDAELIEKLGRQQLHAEQNYRDTLIHFVKKMGTSIAIYPTTVRWTNDDDIPYYDSLATAFALVYPESEISQYVTLKVQQMKRVAIGAKAPGIIAKDTSGHNLSLYQNLKTYTLVDFWGSWCSPCRTENPILQQLYATYKNQGFEIYGIALEQNKKLWTNALLKDGRSWINVSELNGYKTNASQDYSVTALPKNFLLDKDGIIIAKDIHGQELQDKIAALFAAQQ